jgi:hypothetical protein
VEIDFEQEAPYMRHALTLVLILAIAACGGGDIAAPPAAPGTPAPPVPSPSPSEDPFKAACGVPLPPFESAYGYGIRVQLEPTKNRKVLNASPAVRDLAYCEAAGFPNTQICNTRREDSPERVPCDHYLSGMSDQGRPGPTWYQDFGDTPNGNLVKCGEPGTTCQLKEENQYLLDITEVGWYIACSEATGTCGDCGIMTMEQSQGSLGGLCKHR